MALFTLDRLKTVAIAALGAAVFWAAGLPLPFLFGPMTACLVAALAGARLQGLGQVSVAARTILGVAVGASITPEVVGQLPQMALSVAFVPLYVLLIALIGVPFFTRVCGFDRVTAWYAAMPGGLQDMIAFGQEAGGDPRTLSLVHATRVLIIITLVPILMTKVFGIGLSQPFGEPVGAIPPHELGLMALAAILGWKGGEKIGLFGASIIGPMIVTAALSLTDLIHHRPPSEAIVTAQFFIGMGVGVYYVGVTFRELRRDVLAGIAFVAIMATLAIAFTWVVSSAGLAAPAEAFLAFAPGGQAEMTLLAIIAGADLGYIIVHHLTRMVVVILGAPVAARLLRRRKS